jgi:hypothetical protein
MLNNAEQNFLFRKDILLLITLIYEENNIPIGTLILRQDTKAVYIYKTLDFLRTKKGRMFVFTIYLILLTLILLMWRIG